MILAFRRLAATWFAKALFALLILSFAVWGIEDLVRGWGRDNAVARVGGEAIELTEAQDAARRETLRAQRESGFAVEPDAAFREAAARRAVEGIVADRVLRQEAARLGVAASAGAIRDYTFAIPTFQGADGRFSRLVLDQFLRQNDLSEAGFLALVAADLRRQQVVGAVRAGAAAPAALTAPLIAWEGERRVAEVAELPLLDAPEPPEPTEDQLARFHENEPGLFSAPEFREASLALLAPEALVERVAVGEAAVEEGLEAQRARLSTPERRALEQALLPSREAAETVREAWAAGLPLPAAAERARALGGDALVLGTFDRAGLPLPDLAEAAFSTPEGGVSGPVRSAFGWHVVRVAGVQPGQTPPPEALRDAAREAAALERAADLAYQEANRLEDALAGGASVEEAANRLGLPLTRVRLDSRGLGEDGRPVGLPGGPEARPALLRDLFAARPGDPARVSEQAGRFVALQVVSVTPSALRPLAEVREEVRRRWRLDRQARAQEERAAALLRAVAAGTSLEEAAAAAGLPVGRVGPFGREAEPGAPPPELLPGLFAAAAGEATMARTAAGYAVARLVEVRPPEPGADPLAATRARALVEGAMQEELEAQFLAALRARAAVTVNPSLMGQVATR